MTTLSMRLLLYFSGALRHKLCAASFLNHAYRFRVTNKAVASRIQYLVENEFIERDGKDPDMYHFIP